MKREKKTSKTATKALISLYLMVLNFKFNLVLNRKTKVNNKEYLLFPISVHNMKFALIL